MTGTNCTELSSMWGLCREIKYRKPASWYKLYGACGEKELISPLLCRRLYSSVGAGCLRQRMMAQLRLFSTLKSSKPASYIRPSNSGTEKKR